MLRILYSNEIYTLFPASHSNSTILPDDNPYEQMDPVVTDIENVHYENTVTSEHQNRINEYNELSNA